MKYHRIRKIQIVGILTVKSSGKKFRIKKRVSSKTSQSKSLEFYNHKKYQDC
jgi:hypothetical protein